MLLFGLYNVLRSQIDGWRLPYVTTKGLATKCVQRQSKASQQKMRVWGFVRLDNYRCCAPRLCLILSAFKHTYRCDWLPSSSAIEKDMSCVLNFCVSMVTQLFNTSSLTLPECYSFTRFVVAFAAVARLFFLFAMVCSSLLCC